MNFKPEDAQMLESRQFAPAEMLRSPVSRMPTAEDVLAGDTQGGVPRPTVSTDAIFVVRQPVAARSPSFWARIRALFGSRR